MKRMLSVLLSLALLLSCAGGLAEAAEKQVFGTIQINGEFTLVGTMPEGYRIVPMEQSSDLLMTRIVSEDPSRPEMMLSIAYDESYCDVNRMNELDEEALNLLEKTFLEADPEVNISYDETQLGTRLLVARTTSEQYDYLDILSIYNGYFVEFVMYPGKEADPQRLTEEQVASCNAFLTELDFVPGLKTAQTAPEQEDTGDAWQVTEDFEITDEDRAFFSQLRESLTDVDYEPIAYLGSGDAGMNHCYLCRELTADPEKPSALVLLYLRENEDGNPVLLKTAEIDLASFGRPAD